MSKLPGYETVVITRIDLSDDGLKTLKERIASIIKSFDGEMVYQEDWGKRKFAYLINKESRGHYSYFAYTAKGDVVTELERNLRLSDHVVRFMTVNLAKEFDKEVFMKELGNGTSLKREERGPTTNEGAPIGHSETKSSASYAAN